MEGSIHSRSGYTAGEWIGGSHDVIQPEVRMHAFFAIYMSPLHDPAGYMGYTLHGCMATPVVEL